jgi:predicted RNase H-like HicB family nuclease
VENGEMNMMGSVARSQRFTVMIEREGDGYVSLCPELDIASQGNSVEGAKLNLKEAIELFFEVADVSEIRSRLSNELEEVEV